MKKDEKLKIRLGDTDLEIPLFFPEEIAVK